MARVFITGGSGFVGAHVVRQCVADGHEVSVFAPAPGPCLTEADMRNIWFVPGGVEEAGALEAMIATAKPDVVIGLAAYGEGARGLLAAAAQAEAKALEVNVGGFRNLLAACARFGISRLLWASTFAVFGDPKHYPNGTADEDAPRHPQSFYGLTKMLAEDLARYWRSDRGLPVTGVRLPLVFGPGLWYRGAAADIAALCRAAADGGEAAVSAASRPVELMYVKDVARAFALLVRHEGPLALIYNLCAYAPSLSELVVALKSLSPEFSVSSRDVEASPAYPSVTGRRFADDTGFRLSFPLERACADYVGELRSGG